MKMTVFEAIKRMRKQSEQGIPFAFSYMSYSIDKEKSEGVIEVANAVLLPRKKSSKGAYAEHTMLYKDEDTGEIRQCWQPLVMTYNNKILEGITG